MTELGLNPDELPPTTDPSARYYYLTQDGRFVAIAYVCIVEFEAHIRLFGVDAGVRHKKLGSTLIRLLLEHLIQTGVKTADIHTSQEARGFCEKQGFFEVSAGRSAHGFDAVEMRNTSLELILATPTEGLNTPANFVLQKDSQVHEISNVSTFKQHVAAMIPQARRQVFILSRALEHAIFDQEVIRNSLSQLARTSEMTEVRLLVLDDKALFSHPHSLTELIKRMPSLIELRVINPDYQADNFGMVLVDSHGVIYQRQLTHFNGFANYNHMARVKQMRAKFKELWDVSRPSAEFREITL